MKIKEGFILRKIADIQVAVPAGETIVDFNGIITLNDTAAFLFTLLQEETSKEILLDKLTNEFDIDTLTAKADIEAFCELLKEANLIA